MSEPKWSNVLPTERGWFWVREKGSLKGSSVVEVMAGWVHSVLSMQPVNLKEYKGSEIEWYGPIHPPE